MMYLASFRAEWFKLIRRPATWVLVALVLLFAVGLSYVVLYLVATHPPSGRRAGEINFALLRANTYPKAFIQTSVMSAGGLSVVFTMIMGVLAQGSEYGWGTVKTVQTQLPGRLQVYLGRLLALALMVFLVTVLLFAADGVASALFASLDGKALDFPALWTMVRGLGTGFLLLGFSAAFGFSLATFFRQTAMAIGLALAYFLVIEPLLFALLGPLGDTVRTIHTFFPVANVGYLSQAFGTVPGFGGTTAQGPPEADAVHATLLLFAWMIGLLAVSALLVKQRDIA